MKAPRDRAMHPRDACPHGLASAFHLQLANQYSGRQRNEWNLDPWTGLSQLNLEQTFLTSPLAPVSTPMLPIFTMESAKSWRK